jgi:GrpB-like predicted nucleotidyltransferase (UPF0157 family)
MDMKPVIVAYRPEWRSQATDSIELLEGKLGDTALRIEHIGSTAIPSMSAKDVLDLQVSVDDLDIAVETFDGPLRALGYQRSPHESDHVPAGSNDRACDWSKRLWTLRSGTGPDINLHVRRDGSPNERLALLFRDWFRSHPEAVPSYGHFKRVLADTLATTDDYPDVKDPVVDLVIAVAEAWARECDWQP